MIRKEYRFKKGAASFYMVAFSTLILLVVATSFAAIIVSEVTRTANDDLAQSAYDSALPGVDDAKLAFYSYQKCLEQGATETEIDDNKNEVTCGEIIHYMNNPDCDMVANILGRSVIRDESDSEGSGEVMIEESVGSGNNMSQAYTCVKIEKELSDYRTTLSSANQMKAVKVKFAGVSANDISSVKVSWFTNQDNTTSDLKYSNFSVDGQGNGNVVFGGLGGENGASAPPTISLAMIQTGATFSLDSFEKTVGRQTNRGMVYLVPAKNEDLSKISGQPEGYVKVGDGKINEDGFLKSNDKAARNLPYVVGCNPGSGTDFVCSVEIALPKPIDGDRNNNTFVFVVGLPYGTPSTDVSLEFICADGAKCGAQTITNDDGTEQESYTGIATLDGVQISIDSTGRANDMYRRVEARLEGSTGSSLSLMGPLELLGTDGSDGGTSLLEKDLTVTSEYGINPERN